MFFHFYLKLFRESLRSESLTLLLMFFTGFEDFPFFVHEHLNGNQSHDWSDYLNTGTDFHFVRNPDLEF